MPSPNKLDVKFGAIRTPDEIRPWEVGRQPISLVVLDKDVGDALRMLEKCVQTPLLRSAARAHNYLWVINNDGDILIAVEELAETSSKTDYAGYPLLRGFPFDPEPKKLGHPTLLGGSAARIAGELAFDSIEDRMTWVMNPNSGRYCRQQPPTRSQVEAVADEFQRFGLNVYIDYL